MNAFLPHLGYALAWLVFGLCHSLLARDGVKNRLKPFFGAFYRLSYNVFAVLQIALVYSLGTLFLEDEGGFDMPFVLWWTLKVIYGCGWLMMFWALKYYDTATLLGTRQVREYFAGVMAHDEEPLRFDGFHQWMRHPLYSAGFLILWGRVEDEFSLVTAVWASLYLLIGTYFEERHLLRVFGDHYATYRSRVPAFIPWKGPQDLKDPKP